MPPESLFESFSRGLGETTDREAHHELANWFRPTGEHRKYRDIRWSRQNTAGTSTIVQLAEYLAPVPMALPAHLVVCQYRLGFMKCKPERDVQGAGHIQEV